MRISDWSSDVCSSDLCAHPLRCSQPRISSRRPGRSAVGGCYSRLYRAGGDAPSNLAALAQLHSCNAGLGVACRCFTRQICLGPRLREKRALVTAESGTAGKTNWLAFFGQMTRRSEEQRVGKEG